MTHVLARKEACKKKNIHTYKIDTFSILLKAQGAFTC